MSECLSENMATEVEACDSQIQEKTVSSFTEDLKMKSESDDGTNEVVHNGITSDKAVNNGENVQVSDNTVDDEKQTTEPQEEKQDDPTKAENVTSTEAGPTEMVSEEKKKEEEKKNEDEAQKKEGDSLGSTVAKHYNEIPAGTKELRKESRIFHLRNFNNWVKSVIINEYLEKIKRKKRTSDDINVLDLACGKGGDLLKWQKGKIDHVIMADIAATSIDQCKERYARLDKEQRHSRHSRDRLFTIETFAADCTKELLKDQFKKPQIKLDLTSCQFAFHYSFETYEQADMMLRNACENLQVGGYFVGTTPDAQKLVKRIKACKADSFGNSVFNIKAEDNEKFPLFGAKYMFYLEGVVDCPEFIVYLPALEKLAEKYSMKLVWKKNFHELFKQYERQYSSLLQKMNAMEQYPAKENKTLSGGSESQYKCAKDYIDKKASSGSKQTSVGTLSADEWEVAGLYLAFAFEKVAPPREARSEERGHETRKRHRDDRSSESTKSRDKHHDKRKSSESSSSKRSKKEPEEVYEVKDEIYDDDEGDKVEADKVEANKAEADKVDAGKVDAKDTTKSPTEESASIEVTIEAPDAEMPEVSEQPEIIPQEASSEETGNEVVDENTGNTDEPVEVAQEATEEITE